MRAMETVDGKWKCRHGLAHFDTHDTLGECIDHLRQIAKDWGPHQVIVHRLEGDPEYLPVTA